MGCFPHFFFSFCGLYNFIVSFSFGIDLVNDILSSRPSWKRQIPIHTAVASTCNQPLMASSFHASFFNVTAFQRQFINEHTFFFKYPE